MQVTLRHRQAGAARFFVDCEVQFSEEEKAIIYQRGLGKHTIRVPTGIPHGSGVDLDSLQVKISVYVATFCFLISLLLFFMAIVAHEALPWAILWLLGAVGLIVYYCWALRRRRASEEDQTIPIQRLLSNPVFTVAASDLNQAQYRESAIRSALSDMKNFIMGNAVVKEVETFQL